VGFRRAEDPESDPGEWFTYGRDRETGKEVRFRVRRLLPKVAAEIEQRHGVVGRNVIVVGSQRPAAGGGARKGDAIVPPGNNDAEIKVLVEKAVLCLADSENCIVTPVGPKDASAYTDALAEPVSPGQDLVLDGRLGRRELRERFLTDELVVARWVATKASRMGVDAAQVEAEEEAGKDDA
jgi:hypothetical protein